MTEYRWAAGCRLTKKTADPQVVGDTLEQLQQENGGRITPRVVVDAARPVESPLHPCFEWDDIRAAELYREDQARHVISSVRIVQRSDNPKDEPRILRAYVNLTEQIGDDEETRGYVPLARVLDDAMLLRQAIERAASELRACEEKYRDFELIARAIKSAREAVEQAAA